MYHPRRPKLERPKATYTCEQCAFAELDRKEINRSLDGRYFMLRCQFTPWKKFFKDAACERFMQRQSPITQ